MVLTDHQYVILNLLRSRTDQEAETRFAVREVYPKGAARQYEPLPSPSRCCHNNCIVDVSSYNNRLQEILCACSPSDHIRKILMPYFGGCDHVTIYIILFIVYGAALLDHALIGAGFDEGASIGNIDGQCYYYSNNPIL